MVIGPDTSHDAQPAQFDEIDRLLRAAFGGPHEAELVRRLRANGEIWSEMVKPAQHRIAGYYALSRMIAPVGWACLAPVAVWPEFQNGALAKSNPSKVASSQWRVGSRMMQELQTAMETSTVSSSNALFPEAIVVLGKPSFYERFGFSRNRARNLTTPYPIEYTMILGAGDDAPTQTLIYPSAFDDMS